MKTFTFVIIITLLFMYQKRDEIQSYLHVPADDYASVENVEVIMFSTSWCGYCAKARSLLKELDVQYIEYDIESSKEAHQQYIDLGGRGVPLLLIGGKVVKGYNPSKIKQLVR